MSEHCQAGGQVWGLFPSCGPNPALSQGMGWLRVGGTGAVPPHPLMQRSAQLAQGGHVTSTGVSVLPWGGGGAITAHLGSLVALTALAPHWPCWPLDKDSDQRCPESPMVPPTLCTPTQGPPAPTPTHPPSWGARGARFPRGARWALQETKAVSTRAGGAHRRLEAGAVLGSGWGKGGQPSPHHPLLTRAPGFPPSPLSPGAPSRPCDRDKLVPLPSSPSPHRAEREPRHPSCLIPHLQAPRYPHPEQR